MFAMTEKDIIAQMVKDEKGNLVSLYGRDTVEELKERYGVVTLVEDKDVDAFILKQEQELITEPKEITEDQYWEALGCLPPSRYKNGRFHICERLTGELVDWYAIKEGKYITFVDYSTLSDEKILSKINNFNQ